MAASAKSMRSEFAGSVRRRESEQLAVTIMWFAMVITIL
jgi:hypothetical protein